MKTIFTFVAGAIAGLFGWTCTLLWLDEHDDSFIIKGFPNAKKRYQKDIECVREEEQAKVNKILKEILLKLEDD